jgi:hypothetical protein
MPESTVSPQSGTKNLATGAQMKVNALKNSAKFSSRIKFGLTGVQSLYDELQKFIVTYDGVVLIQ